MFRSKFKVIQVGAMRSGTKNQRDADGAEQQWLALDVVLEEDNPNAWRTETAKLTLLGEDAKLALVPGMTVEVTLFLSTRMHDNKIYNEVLYKSLKVLS